MFKLIRYGILFVLLISLLTYVYVLYQPTLAKQAVNATNERIFSLLHAKNAYSSSYMPPDLLVLIQQYVLDPDIHTIVVLGCAGYKNFAEMLVPIGKQFTCYDVVPQIIHEANDLIDRDNLHFYFVESLEDYIAANVAGDLLVSSDFLAFWPDQIIVQFLSNVLPKFKYAIVTNIYTRNGSRINSYAGLGQRRMINLLRNPFNLTNVSIILEYRDPTQKYRRTQVLLAVPDV